MESLILLQNFSYNFDGKNLKSDLQLFIFLVISKKKAPKTAHKILFVIENFALDEKVFSGMWNTLRFSICYLHCFTAVSPPLAIKFML